MVFINLEKEISPYDRIPRDIRWFIFEEKQVFRYYIEITKDMYDSV